VIKQERSRNREELKEWEKAELFASRCPDCAGEYFLEGPSGGMSTNWMCANDACGSRFNLAPLGPKTLWGERISEPMPLQHKLTGAQK
jgi:hypothetical protein